MQGEKMSPQFSSSRGKTNGWSGKNWSFYWGSKGTLWGAQNVFDSSVSWVLRFKKKKKGWAVNLKLTLIPPTLCCLSCFSTKSWATVPALPPTGSTTYQLAGAQVCLWNSDMNQFSPSRTMTQRTASMEAHVQAGRQPSGVPAEGSPSAPWMRVEGSPSQLHCL